MLFAGLPQKDLLHLLQDGSAEVAILPTCILEQAIAQGRYKADQFRVILPQAQSALPCQSSTPLYPSLSLAYGVDPRGKVIDAVTEESAKN